MKLKYRNNRCPICGLAFHDLNEEGEFICPECYTTVKVKYFEHWNQELRMADESGYYIDPDDYRPLKLVS